MQVGDAGLESIADFTEESQDAVGALANYCANSSPGPDAKAIVSELGEVLAK